MDSSHIVRTSSRISQKDHDQYDTFHHQARKYPSSRSHRTPSFSSSSSYSSSTSYNPSEPDSPLSPATPLNQFSGRVPFSWEHYPGIPKKQQQFSKKNRQHSSSSMKLLPLPPTTNRKMLCLDDINGAMIKIKKTTSSDVDPFFAALIECSKDDDDDQRGLWNNINVGTAKVSRSLSDRFGFISLYASCKRTCAVAESIRHLPKSTTTRSSSSCGLIKYPSR